MGGKRICVLLQHSGFKSADISQKYKNGRRKQGSGLWEWPTHCVDRPKKQCIKKRNSGLTGMLKLWNCRKTQEVGAFVSLGSKFFTDREIVQKCWPAMLRSFCIKNWFFYNTFMDICSCWGTHCTCRGVFARNSWSRGRCFISVFSVELQPM